MRASKTATPASILIILTGSLGDVTRGLSVVKPLKDFWPQAKLCWLVEQKWAGLLKLNPYIDEVMEFKRSAGPANLLALRKKLRKHKFDISLDFQRIFKSGFFAFLACAPLRLGFNRQNAKEFNWLFNNRRIPFYQNTLPKLEHYLKFLDELHVPYPDKPDYGMDRTLLTQTLPKQFMDINTPYAVLVVGSSWPSKDWHAAGYRRLAQYLKETRNITSVLTGDKTQTDIATEIMGVNNDYFVDLTGKTSLPELAAVLGHAQFAVGPDSGAGHIAAATGTPYITLFGPTSPERTSPYGYDHLVVQIKLECAPCYNRTCHDNRCMHQIDIEDIEPKIKIALGE